MTSHWNPFVLMEASIIAGPLHENSLQLYRFELAAGLISGN
jgi:hypothetical protein